MEEGFRGLYGCWKIGGRGECDLKASHARPKTEYVRTYIGVFDRTCAGAWVHE
jgi:hypothetical protein